MVIYDYEDRAHEINVSCLPETIHVRVISGDEIVTVNGITYDSSDDRAVDFFDNEYDVTGIDMIEQWMNFKPDLRDPLSVSYQRAEAFRKGW